MSTLRFDVTYDVVTDESAREGDFAESGFLFEKVDLRTAADAASPCRSGRYFPPDGETAARLGWAEPYWHADEIVKIIVLD